MSKKLINQNSNYNLEFLEAVESNFTFEEKPINRLKTDTVSPKTENTEKNIAGIPPSREIKSPNGYEGVHRERQIEVAIQLFKEMGIQRDDKELRNDWVLRGFRQFDAPVAVVVTFDSILKDDDISKFDCGAVVNGLVNAGWSGV